MIFGRRELRIETERLLLRLPQMSDWRAWSALRHDSAEFLKPWEPTWAPDHLSRRAFANRVSWARRSVAQGTAVPLFLIRREDGMLLGAITLDNIRRGPAQSGTTGYWVGEPFARQGYMREAVMAVVDYAFGALDLSRIEAVTTQDVREFAGRMAGGTGTALAVYGPAEAAPTLDALRERLAA